MQIELAEVRAFCKVAQCSSFSAAAREMGQTPSAVSKLIQRLESRLGVKLFYRTSRSLRLTEDGVEIYEASRKALVSMDELVNLAAGRAAQVSGVLRVHTLLTFAMYQLAPLLQEFKLRYPRIKLELMLSPEPVDLIERNVDVAIHVGAPADSSLVCRTIARSRWLLCAAPSYLRASGTPRQPSDLAQHQCLNFIGRAEWNLWPLHGGHAPFKSGNGAFATNQGEMMLALARQGLGIVRLAEYHVAEHLRQGKLIEVLGEFNSGETQPISLMYHSRHQLSPRVRHFCDFIAEKFQQGAPWLPRPHG